MQYFFGEPDQSQPGGPALTAPNLLVELPPRHQVFLTNLADLLLRRQPAVVWGKPAPFWPDVFVAASPPWAALRQSALYHIFAVVAIWGLSHTWLARPQLKVESPLSRHIAYYSVSEYLPPLETGSTEAKEERKGDPAPAKQQIVSLPPNPDNFRQTIVTPDKVRLPGDVSIPNLVAWTPVPAPLPLAATERSTSQLTLPQIPLSMIAPPPDVSRADMAQAPSLPTSIIAPPPQVDRSELARTPAMPMPEVIAPSPTLEGARSHVRVAKLPDPAVIGPPPATQDARRLGEINIARMDPQVAAPKLPAEPQVAMVSGQQLAKPGKPSAIRAQPGGGVPAPPPAAAVTGGDDGRHAVGQVIALGLNPADVRGPIEIPRGSRAGEFSAGPEGKPGASGRPEIRPSSGSGEGRGRSPNSGSPTGISVAPGPGGSAPGGGVVAQGSVREKLLASIAPPGVSDLARLTRPGPLPDAPDAIAGRVFGTRRYYSVSLNMPNLTSAGGSWIIRFAELNDDPDEGDLTAPVATLKVDPAYPAEALREQLEGTVTLHAIIHKDGTVGEVQVLRGVDTRLDENARTALLRWKFRPATKNGAAVDLEAVVQIPFRVRQFGF